MYSMLKTGVLLIVVFKLLSSLLIRNLTCPETYLQYLIFQSIVEGIFIIDVAKTTLFVLIQRFNYIPSTMGSEILNETILLYPI